MTWNINNFVTLSRYHEGDTVTFRDDSKGKIVSIGNIKIDSSPLIENIILVDGLKHNLLSISQFCDKSLRVIFDDSTVSLKVFCPSFNDDNLMKLFNLTFLSM